MLGVSIMSYASFAKRRPECKTVDVQLKNKREGDANKRSTKLYIPGWADVNSDFVQGAVTCHDLIMGEQKANKLQHKSICKKQ